VFADYFFYIPRTIAHVRERNKISEIDY